MTTTINLAFVKMDDQEPVEDGTYIIITKNGALCTARWVFGSWNAQFADCVYRWARINRETMMYLRDRDMSGNPKKDEPC